MAEPLLPHRNDRVAVADSVAAALSVPGQAGAGLQTAARRLARPVREPRAARHLPRLLLLGLLLVLPDLVAADLLEHRAPPVDAEGGPLRRSALPHLRRRR